MLNVGRRLSLGRRDILKCQKKQMSAAYTMAPASTNRSGTTSSSSNSIVELNYTSNKPKKNSSKKTPIVIHHSLMSSSQNWSIIAKELQHMTRRQIVCLDARNHGHSPHTTSMSYPLMAADTKHLINKTLEQEKVSYVGHCMGGRVGALLAVHNPNLFDKLVLIETNLTNTKFSVERWTNLRKAVSVIKSIEPHLMEIHGAARSLMADKAIREFLTNPIDRSVLLVNMNVQEGCKPEFNLNLEAILENPTFNVPLFNGQKYEGKVLFISGERSKFVKRENDEEVMKTVFPNAKITWIKDAGHWLHAEKHSEFLQALVPFLEID